MDNYFDDDFKKLILDEKFQQWVYEPSEQLNAYWNEWLSKNPDKKDVVEETRKFILALDFKPHYPLEKEFQEDWEKLNQRIEQYEQEKIISENSSSKAGTLFKSFKTRRLQTITAIAASILVLFVITWLFFLNNNKNTLQVFQTKFAQTQKIVLPDGSEVVLNANSSIKYADVWKSETIREVWLEGEAFFTVKKTSDRQKFIVHSGEIDVEVLGTEFNVNTRHKTPRVVLNSGKVRVTQNKSVLKSEVIMQPQDMVTFNPENKELLKERVDTEIYTSWRNGLLTFKMTSLSEIAKILEDNYNYHVTIADSKLADRKFIGTFPANKINVLLSTLSVTIGVEVSGNNIKFTNKDKNLPSSNRQDDEE